MKNHYNQHTILRAIDVPYETEYDIGEVRMTHPKEEMNSTAELKKMKNAMWAITLFNDGTHAVTKMNNDPTIAWGGLTIVERFKDKNTYMRASYNHNLHLISKEVVEHNGIENVWIERKSYTPDFDEKNIMEIKEFLNELLTNKELSSTLFNNEIENITTEKESDESNWGEQEKEKTSSFTTADNL